MPFSVLDPKHGSIPLHTARLLGERKRRGRPDLQPQELPELSRPPYVAPPLRSGGSSGASGSSSAPSSGSSGGSTSSSSSRASAGRSRRRVRRREGSPAKRALRRELLRDMQRSARRLRRASRQDDPVPSGVPDSYRRLVRKYGPEVEKVARERYGLSGEVFLAKMLKGESNFSEDMGITGPNTPVGNARGPAQFIPSTRQDMIERFGIDPWRSKREAVAAMAKHLDGRSYGRGGIEGYNPGKDPSYYLNQDVGEVRRSPEARRQAKQAKRRLRRVERRAESAGLPGVAKRARRVRRTAGERAGGSSRGLWEQKPGTRRNKPSVTAQHGGVLMDGMDPAVMSLGRTISRRSGLPIELISANRPGATTTSGNRSDHADGRALDIHALAVGQPGGTPETERRGDRIAFHAARAVGIPVDQAKQFARNGGDLTTEFAGYRVQILWKTWTGGNHFNHVHVGIKPSDGSGAGSSFTPGGGPVGGGSVVAGSPSAGVTYDSGVVSAMAEQAGVPVQAVLQMLDEEPLSGIELLQELGYRVTPSEISSPGRSRPKADLGRLRRKYRT